MQPLVFPEIEKGFYWYLATPYTSYPYGKHEAFVAAAKIHAALVTMGHRIFCPIVHHHTIQQFMPEIQNPDQNHDYWMKIDRPFMLSSYGILVACMEGMAQSRGVAHEIEHFERTGRPVYFLGADWVRDVLGRS
jgi:hypothetical protein